MQHEYDNCRLVITYCRPTMAVSTQKTGSVYQTGPVYSFGTESPKTNAVMIPQDYINVQPKMLC